MKKSTERVRIQLTQGELVMCKEGLKAWIKEDRRLLSNPPLWVLELQAYLEKTEKGLSISKPQIRVTLTGDELIKVIDVVTDRALYKGYKIKESRKLVKKLEGILWEKYQMCACYKVSGWGTIRANNKKARTR